MSTNDDSASRRGRRADPAQPDWRAGNRQQPGERWDRPSPDDRDSGNQYPGQGARDNAPQHAAYSGFTRQSYSQQAYSQPRQEVPPPPPAHSYEPQVTQSYYPEPAPQQPRAPEPQPAPQPYYPEPAPRPELPRSYVEPAAPYAPPPAPYDSGHQHLPYGGTGSDLFGRDSAPQSFDQNPYGAGAGYRPEPYEAARPPLMQPATLRREEPDYHQRDDERLFAARIAQESSASRFYLGEDQPRAIQPERGAPPIAPQPAMDRGYAPSQLYNPHNPPGYGQQTAPHGNYEHDYDPRFPAPEGWGGDDHGFDEEIRSGHAPLPVRADEYDEEFPDEDFDGDDYAPPRKGRKKLFAALLLSAAAVVVGGTYAYKTLLGGRGEKGTPLIQADRSPSREVPDKPGGKQFPHGEKAIYERLTPDGRTQVATFTPPAAQVPPAFAAGASEGSSLEARIDEALRKAQSTGDAPAAAAAGPDQPTVVHSENYRPDGTRVDSRPVITPSIVSVENGLPYPFGNVRAPASQQAPVPAQSQFSTATTPARIAPVRTASRTPALAEPSPAAAVPAAAGGFYVSLKSASDQKAIQREIPGLMEKYKSVLGDVQVASKIADLGARGVFYRAVAGPLGTRQEALQLCEKIKGVGGSKACFVTN